MVLIRGHVRNVEKIWLEKLIMKSFEHSVAKAVRVEKDISSGSLYLVFEIIDESFKKEVEKNWTADIELKLVGKILVKNDGE